MLKNTLAGILAAASLASCSSMPDVTVDYYLPKAETTVTVTAAMDCDASKKVITVYSVAAATAYSSDTAATPVSLKKIDSALGDTALTFNFTDDGRLKGVNTTSTGEGGAIVKAAITLATAVGGAVAAVVPDDPCQVIKNWGGGKPVNITFTQIVRRDDYDKKDLPLNPTPGDEGLFNQLKAHIATLTLDTPTTKRMRLAQFNENTTAPAAVVQLNDVADLRLTVNVAQPAEQAKPIWSSDVVVPVSGSYTLPIPKAALFGKETFQLSLSEAGEVTAIGYGKDNGFSDAMGAAAAIATAATPETPAQEAASIKAQADLIAAEQRLLRCKTNRVGCT